MITDKQVNVFINVFELNGGHFLGNNEFDSVRKALEAYEQSKWVKFDVNDESTYPKRVGNHIVSDGRNVSHKYWDNTREHKQYRNQSWFVSESVNNKKVTHWSYLPEFKE